MKSIFLFSVGILLAMQAIASERQDIPASQIISLSKKADAAMSSILPGGRLFMIEAVLNAASPCESFYHWYYRYVDFDKGISGAIEFVPSRKGCKLHRKWTRDSDPSGMGYLFFNVDTIVFSPSEAAAAVLSVHPQFVWSGYLRIYQPLVPGFDHPLYLLDGTGAEPNGSYIVDSVTKQILKD